MLNRDPRLGIGSAAINITPTALPPEAQAKLDKFLALNPTCLPQARDILTTYIKQCPQDPLCILQSHKNMLMLCSSASLDDYIAKVSQAKLKKMHKEKFGPKVKEQNVESFTVSSMNVNIDNNNTLDFENAELMMRMNGVEPQVTSNPSAAIASDAVTLPMDLDGGNAELVLASSKNTKNQMHWEGSEFNSKKTKSRSRSKARQGAPPTSQTLIKRSSKRTPTTHQVLLQSTDEPYLVRKRPPMEQLKSLTEKLVNNCTTNGKDGKKTKEILVNQEPETKRPADNVIDAVCLDDFVQTKTIGLYFTPLKIESIVVGDSSDPETFADLVITAKQVDLLNEALSISFKDHLCLPFSLEQVETNENRVSFNFTKNEALENPKFVKYNNELVVKVADMDVEPVKLMERSFTLIRKLQTGIEAASNLSKPCKFVLVRDAGHPLIRILRQK